MFEKDLNAIPTRDLLEQAAGCRAIANEADARLLECAQIYADRFHPSICPSRPTRRASDGRERAVVLGGDGCPEIAEFAIAEFAMVIGASPGVGRDLIADALALRHRFPLTWARIQAGEATPWKARQIVRACTKLDHPAAEYVDRRVAAIIDTISPYRLDKITQAAKQYADPERAADEAAEAAEERGVFVGRGDKHGNKTIYIKAPAAAVNRHEAAVAAIAEALKVLGDSRPLQHRRAEAIGIMPDPRFTQELLAQADPLNRPEPNPAEPPRTEPASVGPTSAEPTSAKPCSAESASVEPGGTESARTEATSAEPAPAASAGTASAGTESARTGATGAEPTSAEPASAEPASTDAAWAEAAPSEPGSALSVETRTGQLEPADSESSLAVSTEPVHAEGSGARLAGGSDVAGVLEPCGPPEDPWLEAAGPDDPDPAADPFDTCALAEGLCPTDEGEEGARMDAAALRALNARLAQIKQDAYTNPSYRHPNGRGAPGGPGGSGRSRSSTGPGNLGHPCDSGSPAGFEGFRNPGESVGAGGSGDPGGLGVEVRARWSRGQVRPGKTEVVVHLTDHTLATGTGVLRAENIGPLLATQLTELLGHGPYIVKPVIDLNDAISVNAYEIPTRIRERVKLTHPVELFPYGTRETTNTIDLDHIQPYNPLGPPGQTSTTNLAPLGRFGHRVKTHAHGWKVHRIDHRTLEWTTPNGFTFHVDPEGTHRVDPGIGQTAVHSSVRRTNAATADP